MVTTSRASTDGDQVAFPAALERPDRLTDSVFDLVRDAIMNRSIGPGATVTEAELASRLNVSKTPVRETMIRLKEMGLLVQEGRRLRVIAPSLENIREAYEFRLCIEPYCARLAARNAAAGLSNGVVESAHRSMLSVQDDTAYYATGKAFHLGVAEASGNDLLRRAVEQAHVFTVTLSRRDLTRVVDQAGRANDHEEIAAAISAGDEDLAGRLMERHITVLLDSALKRFAGEE